MELIEKLWSSWLGDISKLLIIPLVMAAYSRFCKLADEKRAEKAEHFDALQEATVKSEAIKLSDSQAALAIMSAANQKCQDSKENINAENLRLVKENTRYEYEITHCNEQEKKQQQQVETLKTQLEEENKKAAALLRLSLIDTLPCIAWTALPDGKLDYYNKRWYDYTGLTEDQTFGWGWDKVIHPDDLQPTLDAWRASLATGEDYRILYRYKRMSDGAWRWYQGRAQPIRENGVIVKWIGCSMDVHELHLSQLRNV